MRPTTLRLGTLVAATALAAAGAAAEAPADNASYSPWQGQDYPNQVFWGDTHLHTSVSLDANLFGARDLGPEHAYRFARGETVTATNGMQARINRPLDFLVVSDHAEYLGIMPLIRAGEPAILENETARNWREVLTAGDAIGFGRMMLDIGASYAAGSPLVTLPDSLPSPWEENNRIADEANTPGIFTAFVGFEWSSMPDGNNLHRVVVLRDGADRANQVTPFSAFDSDDPEALWRYLADYEDSTGGQALAIPHNSNLSGGLMFAPSTSSGAAMSADYARERMRWEPLIEVTQIKGDSEAHPLLSPTDEFADYGTWDQFNIDMSDPQQDSMQRYQYARPALQLGLQLEQRIGVNPFQFGMIGSSDSHTALAAVEEDNYWGKMVTHEPSPDRASKLWGIPEAEMNSAMQLASGYAAVWAMENTREALFDAMRRREVYATTGPRMRVRFFGGWEYTADDLAGPHPALRGYQKGVPMGGELPSPAAAGKAPVFMLSALKEPDGANLDRIQVVKGWVDRWGEPREKIYDVVWAGQRRRNEAGKLEAVGDTVDLARASYANTIGDAELATVWTDPDFDPSQPAVYYARVLEIPTPRWTLHDQVRLDANIPPGTELVHQERAYTSPIWYRPAP
ncbi:DUF3604 domain-containing protein [Haliea sp. E1-2-M8]|uniref:DUF3604 domain-containing protein n=1 Tax=Haliea sp. E1-2-M8 TaxID=3064706 RepID=UPI00271B0CB9|nr:DUF3604 domain-containing protein [Haliea sp. E1-2-M8]MDO8861908.1 DUF3604 domain-containing protein [Haliea sp. E1-2-M8]